jgi:hypothetical protein
MRNAGNWKSYPDDINVRRHALVSFLCGGMADLTASVPPHVLGGDVLCEKVITYLVAYVICSCVVEGHEILLRHWLTRLSEE